MCIRDRVEAYLDIFKEVLRKSGNITSNPFQILNMNREDIAKMCIRDRYYHILTGTDAGFQLMGSKEIFQRQRQAVQKFTTLKLSLIHI